MKRSLPIIRPKEVIRALEREGFFIRRVRGSHYILKHPTKTARVTCPILIEI